MIRQIKEYVDDEGKKVIAFEPIDQDLDIDVKPKTQYRGSVGIMTPQGVLPFEFPFPEDYDLERCYKDFEKNAQEAMDKMQKEAQEQNLIVTPDQVNAAGDSSLNV